MQGCKALAASWFWSAVSPYQRPVQVGYTQCSKTQPLKLRLQKTSEVSAVQGPQAHRHRYPYAGASWARLLDVAECTETFGLLPKGQLTEAWKDGHKQKAESKVKLDPAPHVPEATWQAVLSRPKQAAMKLADTKAVLGFLS